MKRLRPGGQLTQGSVKMIDFRLRTADRRIGGLNMGLCPGKVRGNETHDSIYITELAFSFLEPTIRRHSVGYARSYSHWGITEISRPEWCSIIQDWEILKTNIGAAGTVHEFARVCSMSKGLEDEFEEAFEVNKSGLLDMVNELMNWLRLMLIAHDQVSVVGI